MMLKSMNRVALFSFALLVVVLSGCPKSDKPEGFPNIYPCEIKVVQDGAPLAGANVTLMGTGTWAVGGGTNPEGVAKIYTHGKYEGAPVGKYKVLITKTVIEGAPTQAELDNPSYAGGSGTAYDTVDKKFGTQATTPFEIEIKEGSNSETFDVEKAVKEAKPQA